jgi:hypothetical protein
VHSIAPITISVRCFVDSRTIGIQSRPEPSFSPVMAGRVSDKMSRRKIPEVSVWLQVLNKVRNKEYTGIRCITLLTANNWLFVPPRTFTNFVLARHNWNLSLFVYLSSIFVIRKNINFSSIEQILDDGILIHVNQTHRPLR